MRRAQDGAMALRSIKQRERTCPPLRVDRAGLDAIFAHYHKRTFVSPDPLQFLYDYPDVRDREIVGLIASSLAFGRVAQILVSVARGLGSIGRPAAFVRQSPAAAMRRALHGFRHRYVTGEDVAAMLVGAQQTLGEFETLGAAFAACGREEEADYAPALARFVAMLKRAAPDRANYLLPSPADGSACKRLNLYLRWMVRSDEVDPGGWSDATPTKLLVPVDTHMHRIALALGLTRRRQADLRTAREITVAFRAIAPDDPVRYDFALTRLGIRRDANAAEIVAQLGGGRAA